MTLAKAKVDANETFVAQASLTIITYDCQNIFIVHATVFSIILSITMLAVIMLCVVTSNIYPAHAFR